MAAELNREQVAEIFGVSLVSLRIYERTGYVPSTRRGRGGRIPAAFVAGVTGGRLEPHISLGKAAEEIGTTRRELRRMVADGRLPAIRIGPRGWSIRVASTEVDRLWRNG